MLFSKGIFITLIYVKEISFLTRFIELLAMQLKWECGTKGCVGEGNIRGGYLTKHTTATLCPYSPQNLNKENAPDRFCMNPDFYEVPEPISKTKTIKQEEKKDTSQR